MMTRGKELEDVIDKKLAELAQTLATKDSIDELKGLLKAQTDLINKQNAKISLYLRNFSQINKARFKSLRIELQLCPVLFKAYVNNLTPTSNIPDVIALDLLE